MKHTRRHLIGSMLAGGAVAAGLVRPASAGTTAQLPGWGDAPAGTRKVGSLGLTAPATTAATAAGVAAASAQIPVAIVIPGAGVDAEVERSRIVDGQMLDPSGPWVVAWYEGTGLAGSIDNAVMSGHVDYWDVGPAVFYTVASLGQGAEITVLGVDGGSFTYAVEYVERVSIEGLTEEKIGQIVGPTDYGALTLITCGGEFDYDLGQYYSRDIIRARLVGSDVPVAQAPAQPAQQPAAQPTPANTAADATLAEGGTATVTVAALNVRAEPSTTAELAGQLPQGTTVTITGASQDADGYTWWPVEAADGLAGWVVQDFLQPAD